MVWRRAAIVSKFFFRAWMGGWVGGWMKMMGGWVDLPGRAFPRPETPYKARVWWRIWDEEQPRRSRSACACFFGSSSGWRPWCGGWVGGWVKEEKAI